MRYVEAYADHEGYFYRKSAKEVAIFLAGGITGCADWQARAYELLEYAVRGEKWRDNIVLINPRRKSFDVKDIAMTVRQIEWEHAHLRSADAIFFWFPPETPCPITLFEYGKWLVSKKPLFVGCHPQYPRLQDVYIQTRLERPVLLVHADLTKVIEAALDFVETRHGGPNDRIL